MKKTIIEVDFDEKLNENDIIIFKNGKWKALNKAVFLNLVNKNLVELDDKIDAEALERSIIVESLKKENKNIKKVISYILGEEYEKVLEDLSNEEQEVE